MRKSNESDLEPTTLIDPENWEIVTEVFDNDPGAADTFTHLLLYLKEAIASGPEERLRVITSLTEGIRTAYLYTSEHQLAQQLYELYLTGHLKPQNEPRQLLEGAIARGSVDIQRATALELKRKERKRRKAKKRRR